MQEIAGNLNSKRCWRSEFSNLGSPSEITTNSWSMILISRIHLQVQLANEVTTCKATERMTLKPRTQQTKRGSVLMDCGFLMPLLVHGRSISRIRSHWGTFAAFVHSLGLVICAPKRIFSDTIWNASIFSARMETVMRKKLCVALLVTSKSEYTNAVKLGKRFGADFCTNGCDFDVFLPCYEVL